MTTYRNPWYRAHRYEYGPAEYETDSEPTNYRGYLIYERLHAVWDVVLDDVCITQRAGLRGAKDAIDDIIRARGTAQEANNG